MIIYWRARRYKILLKLENVLPLNANTNIKEPILSRKNYLEEPESKTKIQHEHNPIHQKQMPLVLGPNDELIPIGLPGMIEESEREKGYKRDDIVYRLYEDGLPPYLYYTYKLDTNGYLSYEEMNAHYNNSKKI